MSNNIFNKVFGYAKRALLFINRVKLENGYSIHPSVGMTGANIHGKVNISENAKIINNVFIRAESPVTIGKYSAINGPNTDILTKINAVSIGNFSSIARSVSIQEYNHKYKTPSTAHMQANVFKENVINDVYSKGEIVIGHDVWIGAQSVILSGSKIGNGAIVAANAVVNGDVPAYSIVGGSPASVIGYRFSQEIIEKFESLKWWDWPIEKIKKNKEFFSNEIESIQAFDAIQD